jgi:hypothetical protein
MSGRILLAGVLGLLGAVLRAEEPRFSEFSLRVEHRVVSATVRVESAFDPEVMERVRSGFPVTFTYDFALKSDRRLRDKTWARARVSVTCKYDPVRVEYRLNFRKDGQLFDTRYVHHWPDASRAMVSLTNLALFDVPEEARGRPVFITVRAHLLSRTKWLLLPDDLEAQEISSTIFTVYE